jgi:hypothetical protein
MIFMNADDEEGKPYRIAPRFVREASDRKVAGRNVAGRNVAGRRAPLAGSPSAATIASGVRGGEELC